MPHPGLSLEIKIKELRKIITDGSIHCNWRKYMGSNVMWRLWLKEHRPQHQANSKQFQGTGQKLPSKKVHLEVKKTPCMVWRNKFRCCCWGGCWFCSGGRCGDGQRRPSKKTFSVAGWGREKTEGKKKKNYILGFLCPRVFTLSVDYLSSGRWCFLFLQTKTTLLHTQVCPDSSTPPQILCPSISAGQQSPIPPAAATLHHGSTADRRYFGHHEDTRTGCAYCTGCFKHIPAGMFSFRRHKEREPPLATSHSWRWCCTGWFYQGESNGPPWPYAPANSLVSQPTGWPGLMEGKSGEMGWLQRRIQVK